MQRLSEGRFGPRGARLQELTDDELHEELVRRRQARNPAEPKVSWRKLRQCFANLELGPNASLDDVERAYKKLIERYHPDRHQDDPEQHRTARELSDSLTEAYQTLIAHLKRRQ